MIFELVFLIHLLSETVASYSTSAENGNITMTSVVFKEELKFAREIINPDPWLSCICPEEERWQKVDDVENFKVPYKEFHQTVVIANCLGSGNDTVADILASCFSVHISNTTSLSLFWTEEGPPKVFQPWLFTNFSSVLNLTIDDPFESKFAPNFFEQLPNVKYLQLKTGNTVLPHELFSWLPNLVSLEIEASLEVVRNLKNLQNLEEICITVRASGDTFPNEVFQNLGKPKILRITSDHTIKLPENDFISTIGSLERVQINAHLKDIFSGTFRGLENISSINLSGNSLTRTGSNWFDSQVNLKELYLDHNEISNIAPEPFKNNDKLEVLDLSHNRIREINDSFFVGLKGLKRLYLSHNQIEYIDPYTFHEANIKNIRENSLPSRATSSRFIASYNKNLELVDLSHNLFQGVFLPENDFQNDLTVDLRNNKISWIDLDYLEWVSNQYDVSPFTLRLNQNPLDCNKCDVTNIKTYKRLPIRLEMDNLTCKEPEALKGRLVTALKKDELTCPLGHEACPPGCHCWYMHMEQPPRLLFNCSGLGLSEAPELPLIRSVCPDGCSCKTHGSEVGFSFDYTVDCRNKKPDPVPINATEPKCPKACSFCPSDPIDGYDCSIDPKEPASLQSCPNGCRCEFKQRHGSISVFKSCDRKDGKTLPALTGLFPSNCSSHRLLQPHLFYLNCSFMNQHILMNFGNPDLSIELDLSHNHLIGFPSMTDGGYQNVSRLILSNETRDIHPQMSDGETIYLFPVFLGIVGGLSIATLAILCYLNALKIRIYLFSRGWFWWTINEDDLDKDKIFDAFISYSHADEDFVERILVPELESGDHPYKVCVHVRDWKLGENIIVQIQRSISQSRKTIIVLSKNYLQSCWAMEEFRAAHKNATNEGRINGVVAILMDDKREIEEAGDREFKAYIRTFSYVHKDDPLFWEKLRILLRCPLSARKSYDKNKRRNKGNTATIETSV